MTNRRVAGVVRGLIVLAALASGCATTETGRQTAAIGRPATDTPGHFLVGSLDGGPPGEPGPGTACRNPMIDPRDGTRLILDRSAGGRGEYIVPAGRYGVGEDEVLRIECATGRPIGIFRRVGK